MAIPLQDPETADSGRRLAEWGGKQWGCSIRPLHPDEPDALRASHRLVLRALPGLAVGKQIVADGITWRIVAIEDTIHKTPQETQRQFRALLVTKEF